LVLFLGRKIVMFFTLLLLTILVCGADSMVASDYDGFQKAGMLYDEAQYQEALEQYYAIKERGPAVWHNMGHCFYKLQDDAQAMLCWWKADKNASWEQQEKNREWRNHVAQKYEHAGQKIKNEVPLLFLQILFLVFWFCLMALLRLLCAKRGSKRLTFCILFCMIGAVILLIAFISRRRSDNACFVIIKDAAALKIGPGNFYHVSAQAKKAERAIAVSSYRDWCHVVLDDQRKGWVPLQDVQGEVAIPKLLQELEVLAE
jgi:hypothetical protein